MAILVVSSFGASDDGFHLYALQYCVSYTPGTEYNIYKGRKKLTQLEANYAKCFDTIAKLESQNASLSSTKSLYDNLLERHNFIRRLLSSLKQERDNTGNDNQAKSREIRLLKYKTDTLTRANNGLLRNIDAKEKEIDELKAKINNLQMNIENKDKVVISLTTKETSLSQAVEEKQRQLGRKEETIKTLQEENTKIRTELDSSLEKLNELEDRASLVERDHYSEISRLNSKLKTVEGERNCYEKGLGDMNFLLEGTTHDQQVLIMERDEAITKLQKLTDEFREENKRTQTLRSQLEDVTRKSKYTEELRNVERTQYQRVRETIIREKTQISEQLQREREDFTRKKSELSQQLTALQKDNEKLVSQTSQPSQKELPDESQLTNLRQRDREDFNRQINELWALHRKRCEELEYQMACNSKQHKAERDKLQLEKQQLSQLLQYEREQFNREKEKFSSKILSISNERDSLCIQPPPGLDVQKAKDLAPGAGLVMQIDGTETEEQKEEVPEPPHLKDWREHAEALRNRLVQGTPQGCQQPTQQPRQPALPNSSPDFQKQTRK